MHDNARFVFNHDDPEVSLISSNSIDGALLNDVVADISYSGDATAGQLSVYLQNAGLYYVLGTWKLVYLPYFKTGQSICIKQVLEDNVVIVELGEPISERFVNESYSVALMTLIGEMLRFANEYKDWGCELTKTDDAQLQALMIKSKYL